MVIVLWTLVLVISLYTLVRSAQYFIANSEKLGLALGLSSFIVGATIVAIGTSLPELISAIYAVVNVGNTEFVTDTIIGSNIANALLIIGIGAVYAKNLKVETSLIDVDLPFFFSSMALFVFFAWNGEISATEGLLLLGLLVIFMAYSAKASREPGVISEDKEEMEDLSEQFTPKKKNRKNSLPPLKIIFRYALNIALSAGAIALAAKYLVDSVLILSELIGISSSIITISVVALGTSLPEIITSLAAIRIGNHAIAIGNVFGSNTFNLLMVGGLPALLHSLHISDITLLIGLPFLVVATFVVIFTTLDNKVRSWEGAGMIFLYFVFVFKITQIV